MDEFFCNSCLDPLAPGQDAVAVPCAHLFCCKCAEEHLGNGAAPCPVCKETIAPGDAHAVQVLTDDSDPTTAWSLVGKAPRSALDAALTSFQFALRQSEMYATVRERSAAEAECQALRNNCKAKLNEIYAGYKRAKKKIDDLKAHAEGLAAENGELRQKYNAKDREAAELRDRLGALQRERDELRESTMALARHTGVDPAAVVGLGRGGGGGGGRCALRTPALPPAGGAPQYNHAGAPNGYGQQGHGGYQGQRGGGGPGGCGGGIPGAVLARAPGPSPRAASPAFSNLHGVLDTPRGGGPQRHPLAARPGSGPLRQRPASAAAAGGGGGAFMPPPGARAMPGGAQRGPGIGYGGGGSGGGGFNQFDARGGGGSGRAF